MEGLAPPLPTSELLQSSAWWSWRLCATALAKEINFPGPRESDDDGMITILNAPVEHLLCVKHCPYRINLLYPHLPDRYHCYHPSFRGEETEAQRG